MAHRSPAFRKGNVLISIRNLDTIGVVDLKAESVVWALSGQWKEQHQPTVLENGHMLIFDNLGHNGKSRVLEFDPFSQVISWVYENTPEPPFFSKRCGSNERLPNGNTLITESDAGRAFEVTSEKEIVWEFFNPYRTGINREMIPRLLEVIRLRPDFPVAWSNPDREEE